MNLHSFARDRHGIAAVEFALVGPVMLLLLIGILETASLIFTKWSLESAAYDAARYGSTGWQAGGSSREDRILDIVAERSFGTALLSNLTVESRIFPDVPSLVAATVPTDGLPGPGGADDLVLYFVAGTWQPMTPIFDALFGAVPLTIRVPVRNEPF